MTGYDGPPSRDLSAFELSPEQSEADEHDLHAGLKGLARMVAGARGMDELLKDVAEFAVQAIPGVDHAGATVIRQLNGRFQVQAWQVTDDLVRDIDTLQYEVLKEGPGLTAMQTGHPVVAGALRSDIRWPRFGARLAGMGVRSALSIPLLIGEDVIGAINSYAYSHYAFTEHALRLGTQFAGPAAVSVANAQLLTQARDRAE